MIVTGELRVKHLQASLQELGQVADPALTKDAIAGRIRRLLAPVTPPQRRARRHLRGAHDCALRLCGKTKPAKAVSAGSCSAGAEGWIMVGTRGDNGRTLQYVLETS